jgi:hypothetical protein
LLRVFIPLALGLVVAPGQIVLAAAAAERAADAVAEHEADAERADREGDGAAAVLLPPVERLRDALAHVLVLGRHGVFDVTHGLRDRVARLLHPALELLFRRLGFVAREFRGARGS